MHDRVQRSLQFRWTRIESMSFSHYLLRTWAAIVFVPYVRVSRPTAFTRRCVPRETWRAAPVIRGDLGGRVTFTRTPNYRSRREHKLGSDRRALPDARTPTRSAPSRTILVIRLTPCGRECVRRTAQLFGHHSLLVYTAVHDYIDFAFVQPQVATTTAVAGSQL